MGAIGQKITGAISGWMVMRDEARAAAEEIAEVAAEWRRVYDGWQLALKARERLFAQMERRVAAAQAGVDAAIANMARQLSADLAANVLDLDVAKVRRVAKSCPPAATNGNAR